MSESAAETLPPSSPPQPACALAFNAVDPSGAGGLAADQLAMASIGAHMAAVATGAYVRDTRTTVDFFALDEDALDAQARAVLEDMDVSVLLLGFAGNADNLGAVAGIASDYDNLPLITYMPPLTWLDDTALETYWDATQQLILPLTTVLVANHTTLWRWLLPDWEAGTTPQPLELARAAQKHGVTYTVITGLARADGQMETVLAHVDGVLAQRTAPKFDANFAGAGETLAATLAALLATGSALTDAFDEAIDYVEQSMMAGYRPGMGHVVPDRLFWAQAQSDDTQDSETDDSAPAPTWEHHHHETKH